MIRSLLSLTIICTVVFLGYARDNALAITPQMGWNSWNAFGCLITEKIMKETVDVFVSLGLDKFGYEYINVDDCWAESRDSTTNLISASEAFPSGMKALADYVHNKGLKFGLYSDAGNLTCAGRPGSLGYENIDAQTYADWGVDYLKYDNCHSEKSTLRERYQAMGDALNRTGRRIFYSMCEWGVDNPAEWAGPIGNSWRTTGDIRASWHSILHNMDLNAKWWRYAGPGGWNDPDMLEIGRYRLIPSQEEAHFSLWAIMKAPLLIGCDLRFISKDSLRILTNTEVIAVNQDSLGKQGVLLEKYSNNVTRVFVSDLFNNSKALVVLNSGFGIMRFQFDLVSIGYKDDVYISVRDLWLHQDVGQVKGSLDVDVKPLSVRMFRLCIQ